jgi:hypothetical protein
MVMGLGACIALVGVAGYARSITLADVERRVEGAGVMARCTPFTHPRTQRPALLVELDPEGQGGKIREVRAGEPQRALEPLGAACANHARLSFVAVEEDGPSGPVYWLHAARVGDTSFFTERDYGNAQGEGGPRSVALATAILGIAVLGVGGWLVAKSPRRDEA